MALKQLDSMTCPNCGGKLEHKGNGYFACPFCDSIFHDPNAPQAQAQKPEEEEEAAETKPATEENIAEIVLDILYDVLNEDVLDDADMLSVGEDPDDHPKIDDAADRFDIPDDVDIWMIWDETFFGSCKYGFAVTSDGIYSNYKENGGLVHIGWEKFIDSKIKMELYTIKIADYEFPVTGGNDVVEDITDALVDIQDALNDELEW